MKIDGHCRCGELACEAEVDSDALNICHCPDCQMVTGWALRASIVAPAEHFVLKSGTPKSYVKTAESGNERRQVFCGGGWDTYLCLRDRRSAELYVARRHHHAARSLLAATTDLAAPYIGVGRRAR